MLIVLRLFGPTTNIKDIRGQAKVSKGRKGRKRPEIVSRLPRFIDLC